MQTAEDKLTEINALTIDLGIKKCDNSKFNENIKRIDESLIGLEAKVSDINNHSISLDNYLDKYQPVRM
jgi:hypothetical protein